MTGDPRLGSGPCSICDDKVRDPVGVISSRIRNETKAGRDMGYEPLQISTLAHVYREMLRVLSGSIGQVTILINIRKYLKA